MNVGIKLICGSSGNFMTEPRYHSFPSLSVRTYTGVVRDTLIKVLVLDFTLEIMVLADYVILIKRSRHMASERVVTCTPSD